MATKIVDGKSFDVYKYGGRLTSEPGVYIVVNDNMDFIYIGQSENVAERFENHHKESCFDRNGATHVLVHVVHTEKRRREIEEDLLDKQSTPCND